MRRGFTLVEVVIALILLEVGLLASFSLLLVASDSLRRAERLEMSLATAEGVADSLASSPEVSAGSVVLPGGDSVVWDAGPGGSFAVALMSDGAVLGVLRGIGRGASVIGP